MRTAFAPLLLLFVAGLGSSQSAPDVDRIEMRLSGWTGTDIELNRQGERRFSISETNPRERSGTFSVTPEQFDRLLDRLEPFRRQAVPFSEESIRQFMNAECPEGVPFVTDHGAIWIRWIGRGSDRHYLADLGCDFERNASRNAELQSVIYSLPIPLER